MNGYTMQNSNLPRIAIIDAGGANFLSVVIALEKLGVETLVTHDKDDVLNADAVILPGVGSAGFAMQKLNEYDLVDTIKNLTEPLLGICLGMQLLYEYSEEDDVACLGIIKGKILKFDNKILTVPHMGWNNLIRCDASKNDTPILTNIGNSDNVYFVHSFYAPVGTETIAKCNYGQEFSAVVQYKNFYGMQFHPEKSGAVGERLLESFIDIVKDKNI